MTRRLLFVTSTRIGDAVLSTGLLAALIEQLDGPAVTVACGPVAAPLFAGVPGLERLLPMPKQRRGGHWLALWKQVAGTAWHTAVDLRGSALLWTLPMVRHRLAAGKAPDGLHRVQFAGSLLGRQQSPPAPCLWTLPRHEAAAEALLYPAPPPRADDPGSNGDDARQAPLLAIAPAANWQAKTWPAESFVELARRLTAPDSPLATARLLVIAGPGEEALAAPLLQALPAERTIPLCGASDLLTVAACLRRCRLFVGNDSGLMHMAGAVGTPVVGLFGPSRVDHFGPWGEQSVAVLARTPYPELVPPGVDLRDSPSLMTSLTVDDAETAALDLLARTTPRPAPVIPPSPGPSSPFPPSPFPQAPLHRQASLHQQETPHLHDKGPA